MGGHQDPRHDGKHPELQSKVITPDILLNPHFASLEMTFYTAPQFPAEFKGDGFACEHGSWNRAQRAGYEVIRLPMRNGHATGEYEDFFTGFVDGPTATSGDVPSASLQPPMARSSSPTTVLASIWHVSYVGH